MWSWERRGRALDTGSEVEMRCSVTQEDEKLKDEGTYRLKGHGEPADLASVHSHRSVGELPREQVRFRERVTLGVEQRQNRRQFIA